MLVRKTMMAEHKTLELTIVRPTGETVVTREDTMIMNMSDRMLAQVSQRIRELGQGEVIGYEITIEIKEALPGRSYCI